MGTAGLYKNDAAGFYFNYAFTKASDPTAFYTGTILASEVQVTKRTAGSTGAAASIANAPVHQANGVYQIQLTQAEINCDEVVLTIVPSAADISAECISLTTEPTPGDVIEIDSNADAAIRLALSADQIIPGTVDTVTNTHTPTVTEFQADDILEATGDHYNGRIVIFTSGNLLAQATEIVDYQVVGGIGQFTVVAMTDAPADNDTFIIV